MPRLLLEGKSITKLLERVRLEHGDDVTIVAADKVRSGGIGGFFARESYALTVEVGAPPHAAGDIDARSERAAAAQAPGSLLDLAAAIDAAEAAEQNVILATAPMHRPMPSPVLSTASPEFHSILERLTALDAQHPVSEEPGDAGIPPTSAPTSGSASGSMAATPTAYERLREALAELAPEVNLATGAPIVLVIAPPAVTPTQEPVAAPVAVPVAVPAASVQAEAPAPAGSIPQQGRHRRATAYAG